MGIDDVTRRVRARQTQDAKAEPQMRGEGMAVQRQLDLIRLHRMAVVGEIINWAAIALTVVVGVVVLVAGWRAALVPGAVLAVAYVVAEWDIRRITRMADHVRE